MRLLCYVAVLVLLLCCAAQRAAAQEDAEALVVPKAEEDAVDRGHADDAQHADGDDDGEGGAAVQDAVVTDARDDEVVFENRVDVLVDADDAVNEVDSNDVDPVVVQDAVGEDDQDVAGDDDKDNAVEDAKDDSNDVDPVVVQDDDKDNAVEDAKDTGGDGEQQDIVGDGVKDAAGDEDDKAAEGDAQDTAETPTPPSSPSPDAPSPSASSAEPEREPPSSRSVVAWFREGVEAYLSEDWKTCATALENAIVEWQYFLRANIECRRNCSREAAREVREAPLLERDVEHLRRTEELVRATLCIMRCKRRAFRGRVTTDIMPASDQKAFRDLKPYEYLQLCYYQSLEFQKAASAGFTIIASDPSNEIMRMNLKYYLSMPEVDPNNLVNYEAEPYVALYFAGTEAYFSENYESAVSNLEESLHEFLEAAERCRADCEGPFDQGWTPDYIPSITNQHVYCLKCKSKCHAKLSQMNGERYDDILPLHYNYLQFAYFKLGRLKDACAAAATYLMFLPADETMLENVEFYKRLPKVESSMFQPRLEAVNYVHRQNYEDSLLRFVADEFIFPDVEEETKIQQSDEIHEIGKILQGNETDPEQYSTKSKAHQNIFSDMDRETGTQLSNVKEVKNVSEPKSLDRFQSLGRNLFNFQEEGDLGGEKRFSLDGLANKRECEELVQFAKMSGVRGDGYDGKKTPHSHLETFEGITLGRAALMVYFGLLELSTLHLFLNLSERGRNTVAANFNISQTGLHFSYTHLVCRSAIPGLSTNASSLSHQIHADNCWLMKDGRCVKESPAYYWRDFSALLYLNDDFDGGEFIFSADPAGKVIQSSIKPTCGRLVGFSAGRENLHGVLGVTRGTRCALALWFTLDDTQSEWARILIEEMIRHLEAGEQPSELLVSELVDLEEFDLKEAEKQMSQAATCDNCFEKTKQAEVKGKSVSLMKSNHSQH